MSTMCTVTGTSMMLGPVRLPVGMIVAAVVVWEGSTAATVEGREATPPSPPPPSLGDGDGGDDQLEDEGGSSGTARPLRPPRSA